MNKNKHYLISDASRQVQVEAHVLRYWEDELGLPIPRNELGHRYYTEFHIQLFRQIKQLKEQGYQLKAIRGILGKVEENQKTEPEALLEAQAQAVFRETGTGERNMSRQENMEMEKNTEVENKETELPQAEVSQRENQGRAEAAAAAPGRFPFFRSRVKKKKFGRNGNKM